MHPIQAVRWSNDGSAVTIIDQRKLPVELVELELRTMEEITGAIRELAVRGAPAIGVAAAMGLALLSRGIRERKLADFQVRLTGLANVLRESRPTAVNLAWALDRLLAVAASCQKGEEIVEALKSEATLIQEEDRKMCDQIGAFGADLLDDGMTVLTHCNTGVLATAGLGTAMAALYMAHEQGKHIRVFASETRPLLQGSRLTAWELARAGIAVTVVTDGAVASLMQRGMINCCIVGADRIARNGDVANKIGTYSHALSAKAHDLPFYVAAPSSTVDAAMPSGSDIRIEERSGSEVLAAAGYAGNADGIWARNPAFDVTPARLLAAIVTEKGVFRPPFDFA